MQWIFVPTNFCRVWIFFVSTQDRALSPDVGDVFFQFVLVSAVSILKESLGSLPIPKSASPQPAGRPPQPAGCLPQPPASPPPSFRPRLRLCGCPGPGWPRLQALPRPGVPLGSPPTQRFPGPAIPLICRQARPGSAQNALYMEITNLPRRHTLLPLLVIVVRLLPTTTGTTYYYCYYYP